MSRVLGLGFRVERSRFGAQGSGLDAAASRTSTPQCPQDPEPCNLDPLRLDTSNPKSLNPES